MRGNKWRGCQIQVNHLLARFAKETSLFPIFEADKGYDSLELREKLLQRKIYPLISYRKMGRSVEEDRFLGIEKRMAKGCHQLKRLERQRNRKFKKMSVGMASSSCPIAIKSAFLSTLSRKPGPSSFTTSKQRAHITLVNLE